MVEDDQIDYIDHVHFTIHTDWYHVDQTISIVFHAADSSSDHNGPILPLPRAATLQSNKVSSICNL